MTICYTNSWNWIVIAIAVAVTIDLVQIIRHSHSFAKKNLIFFNIQALITFTIKCFLFFLLCLYYYAIKLKIESFIYFLLSTTCTLIYARNRYIQWFIDQEKKYVKRDQLSTTICHDVMSETNFKLILSTSNRQWKSYAHIISIRIIIIGVVIPWQSIFPLLIEF